MYIMTRSRKWTIAAARENLASLIGSAAREPQRVYRRDKLVAAVVGPEIAEALDRPHRRSQLAQSFTDLQQLCAESDYELPLAPRIDRSPSAARPRRR